MEQWKLISNTNHQISNLGRLKGPNGHISRSTGGKKRYHQVSLKDNNGKRYMIQLHKVVANAFLKDKFEKKQKEYPNKILEVHHKNANTKDNKAENLEWVTRSENVKAAKLDENNKSGGQKKKIIYINENDKEIIYNSQEEASKELKIGLFYIRELINGKRKKGYYKIKGEKKYVNFKKFEDDFYKNEIWKKCIVPDCDYLLVSDMGRIKSTNTNRVLLGKGKRYKRITIRKDNKEIRTESIHQLVAKTFILNPDNKSVVNHKNGNSLDNRTENLEWCTQAENCKHARENGLITYKNKGRNYYKLELDGNIIEDVYGKDNKYYKIISNNNIGHYQQNGFGYCYIENYKGPIVNPSLKISFPVLYEKLIKKEVTEKINFDKLRKYIIERKRPIWKIKINGVYIEITSQAKENAQSIYRAIKSKGTSGGYCWEYATYQDVLNYPDIIPSKREKHISYRPVWMIDMNGNNIKQYDNKKEARINNNLGRGVIEEVLKGKNKTTTLKTGEKVSWKYIDKI